MKEIIDLSKVNGAEYQTKDEYADVLSPTVPALKAKTEIEKFVTDKALKL